MWCEKHKKAKKKKKTYLLQEDSLKSLKSFLNSQGDKFKNPWEKRNKTSIFFKMESKLSWNLQCF